MAPDLDEVIPCVDECLMGMWLFSEAPIFLERLLAFGEITVVPILFKSRRRFGEMLFWCLIVGRVLSAASFIISRLYLF